MVNIVVRRIINDIFIQIGTASLKTKRIFADESSRLSYFIVIDERYSNVVKVRSLFFLGKCRWLILLRAG